MKPLSTYMQPEYDFLCSIKLGTLTGAYEVVSKLVVVDLIVELLKRSSFDLWRS